MSLVTDRVSQVTNNVSLDAGVVVVRCHVVALRAPGGCRSNGHQAIELPDQEMARRQGRGSVGRLG